jgi:hypothetical protein
MAELYSGRKFDDPARKVDAAVRTVNDAFWNSPMRRALSGISNRVLGGTSGTGWFPNVTATVADGSTGGIKTTTAVTVVIDGVAVVVAAQDNLKMPGASSEFTGTQGSNTVAKYLICCAGTAGTIVGPGNIINKADYATVALANAATKLPELPAGSCALGYALFNTPAASDVVVSSCGLLSTAGTVAYTDLICMPYDG